MSAIAPIAVAALLAGCCGAPAVVGDRSADAGRGAADAARLLARDPDVGVACRKANSIACDRVGVAVWLKHPAAGVTVTIAGRRLRLRQPRSREGWWQGYLQPAGLLDGPLRVTPDRGRYYWQGRHPRDVRLAVAVTRASGAGARTSLTVPLRPGWG